MTRRGLAANLVPALAVATTLLWGCATLGPDGGGGWSAEQRRGELARAKALATRSSPSVQADQPAATFSATTDPQAGRTLDLAEALALAARANRGIGAAEAGVDAASAEVDVTRAALLPTTGVRASYNWYSDPLTNTVDLDPGIFPAGTALPIVTVRQKDFSTMNAAARLAIDLSGELRRALGAAQAGFRAERARAWATRLDEERSVVTSYLGFLEAMRLRDVAAQSVALRDRQLADASSQFDQGRLTRNGVLVVQVAVSDSRQRLLQQANMVEERRRALNRVVGLEIDAPTRVNDVAGRPALPRIEDAVLAVSETNPLVQAMLEEVNAADERAASARRGRLPRVSASAGYDATTADVSSPQDYASTAVSVEWDIASLRREGEIARLDAVRQRTRLLLDRTVREVEALLRSAHDALRERLAAIDAASVALGQAEENLRIRQLQFDEGRATSEDVLDAQDLLTRQRATLASALYQSHARRAELQQLMGRPLAELTEVTETGAVAPARAEVNQTGAVAPIPPGAKQTGALAPIPPGVNQTGALAPNPPDLADTTTGESTR